MPTDSAAATYGELLVPGQPVTLAHPDNLASLARLFGMDPPAVDRCRVLELGAAFGGNLLPMAVRNPESTFVGVDDSAEHVAGAREVASALGLGNVEFRQSLGWEVDAGLGTFDYIICHAMYSRLAAADQRQLLSLCRDRLSSQGVAYVSYKTLPGAAWPALVREVARAGTPSALSPAERVAPGRRLLRFVANVLARETASYARLVAAEVDPALRSSDPWFSHEQFEGENTLFYFHEFVARAAQCGLQYLGDSQIGTMFALGLGADLESSLAQISRDQVALEQHMDFLRNRAFHQSLLCHQAIKLDHRVSGDNLRGLSLAANLRIESEAVAIAPDAEARFISPQGSTIASTAPPVKAALSVLATTWPRAVPFDELLAAVARRIGPGSAPTTLSDDKRRLVGGFLAESLMSGFVEAHCDADRFVTTLSERPVACRWARAQAEVSSSVINRRHAGVTLDAMSQNILPLLDGQRDRGDLMQIVRQAADKGQLSILLSGMPASQSELTGEVLGRALDMSLEQLAASALLIA
jgi:methyltransferase-like protein